MAGSHDSQDSLDPLDSQGGRTRGVGGRRRLRSVAAGLVLAGALLAPAGWALHQIRVPNLQIPSISTDMFANPSIQSVKPSSQWDSSYHRVTKHSSIRHHLNETEATAKSCVE